MSSVQVELRLHKTESLWWRYWPPGHHSKVEKQGINSWIFERSLKNLWGIGLNCPFWSFDPFYGPYIRHLHHMSSELFSFRYAKLELSYIRDSLDRLILASTAIKQSPILELMMIIYINNLFKINLKINLKKPTTVAWVKFFPYSCDWVAWERFQPLTLVIDVGWQIETWFYGFIPQMKSCLKTRTLVIPSEEVYCTILRNKDPKSKTPKVKAPKNQRIKKDTGTGQNLIP